MLPPTPATHCWPALCPEDRPTLADSQRYLLCIGEEKEQCRVTQPAEDTTLSSPERAEQASMHPASSFDHTPEVLSLEIHSVIFKFSFSPNIFFPNNSGKPSEWSPFFPPRTFSIFSAGLQIAGEIVSWAHCFYYFKFFFFFFNVDHF